MAQALPAAELRAKPRLIVGISGASGAIYGARLLELLRPLPVEAHLVMSRAAELTLVLETEIKPADLRSRADAVLALLRISSSAKSRSSGFGLSSSTSRPLTIAPTGLMRS